MACVAAYTNEPLEVGRDQDVYRFVRLLFQWPEAHRGRLAGLVTKALRWDRRLVGPGDVVRLLGLSLQQRTIQPPVAPPEGKCIRFLATVADIAAEGRKMRHCVAYSARWAVDGMGYILHVEHMQEHATIAVDFDGTVVEAVGPKNGVNRATQWGRDTLEAWGKTFAAARHAAYLRQRRKEREGRAKMIELLERCRRGDRTDIHRRRE